MYVAVESSSTAVSAQPQPTATVTHSQAVTASSVRAPDGGLSGGAHMCILCIHNQTGTHVLIFKRAGNPLLGHWDGYHGPRGAQDVSGADGSEAHAVARIRCSTSETSEH